MVKKNKCFHIILNKITKIYLLNQFIKNKQKHNKIQFKKSKKLIQIKKILLKIKMKLLNNQYKKNKKTNKKVLTLMKKNLLIHPWLIY